MHRRFTMTKAGLSRASLGEHLDMSKNSIWNSALEETDRDEWHRQHGNTHTGNSQLGPEFDRQLPVGSLDEFRRCSKKSRRSARSQHIGNPEGPSSQPVSELNPLEDVDTLQELWRHFGRHTTMHGVKNIESLDRKRFSRLVWLILVLGMAALLIYTVASLLLEYYQYNTITRTDVKVHSNELFPSVTLCNTCPYRRVANTSEAVSRLISNTSILTGYFPVNWTHPDVVALLARSMFEIQDEYSFKPEDLFFMVSYEGQTLNASKDFEVIETSFGRCFTFNGPQNIARYGARTVTTDGRNSGLRVYVRLFQDDYFIFEDMTAGIRMFISGYPDSPRLTKDGIDIQPGVSARIALSPVKFTFLPAPYSSYGGESCDDRSSDQLTHKMVNSTFYSHDLCLEQCINAHCSNKCGCSTPHLYMQTLKECTAGDTVTCFNPCHDTVKMSICDCPRPCKFTRYQITMSQSQLPSRVAAEYMAQAFNTSTDALRYSYLVPSRHALGEDYLEIRVYFDTMMVRYETHEPQFTFNSMFAYLGGQMGFFLGASLITLSELLETLVFTVYICVSKKLMRLGQLKRRSARPTTQPEPQSESVPSNTHSNGIPLKQAW